MVELVNRGLAQVVARVVRNGEAASSSLASPTMFTNVLFV